MDPLFGNRVPRERTLRERIDRQEAAAGEVTGAFELSENVGDACDALPHAPALVIGEDECAVPDDWTSQRRAELVTLVLRTLLRGRCEEVPRIQGAVAEKFVCRAVELVGAALEHYVHLPAGIAPEHRVIRIGGDFELANRIHGRRHADSI